MPDCGDSPTSKSAYASGVCMVTSGISYTYTCKDGIMKYEAFADEACSRSTGNVPWEFSKGDCKKHGGVMKSFIGCEGPPECTPMDSTGTDDTCGTSTASHSVHVGFGLTYIITALVSA